jgi:single-strand DNA-binding protein
MLSYLKKGSPLIVVGEMQKPEIFSDREGHPQISMEVTAFQLHFSPFGKPNATPGQGGEASPLSAGSPYHGAPPFGALPEMSPQAPVASGIAPVGSGGASLSSGGTSHSAGETFDDEVPF